MKKKNTTIYFLPKEQRHLIRLLFQFDIFHLSDSILSMPENLSLSEAMEPKWKTNFTLLQ